MHGGLEKTRAVQLGQYVLLRLGRAGDEQTAAGLRIGQQSLLPVRRASRERDTSAP